MTWTATAQGTGAPTPTLGTPAFLDPFGTPLPTRTPGLNLTCPEAAFDTNALEYEWARVCSACVEAVRGTPTPPFGMAVGAFPTLNLSTFTPVPSGTPVPATPTATFTATATPSTTATGTLTPTPVPLFLSRFEFVSDFESWFDPGGSGLSFYTPVTQGAGYVHFGNGARSEATFRFNYNMAIYVRSVTVNVTHGGSAAVLDLSGSNWGERLNLSGAGTVTHQYSIKNNNLVTNPALQYLMFYAGSTPGLNLNLNWVELEWTYAPATPTPTFTPSVTPTATQTLSVSPTVTPVWWATSFPQYAGVSVDCSAPRYIDLNKPLVDWHIGPSETEPVCLTILPQLYIGFDLINNTIGEVFGFELEPIDFSRVTVCFVGISMVINFLGFQLDMSILLGVPILAFLLRWVLFQ